VLMLEKPGGAPKRILPNKKAASAGIRSGKE